MDRFWQGVLRVIVAALLCSGAVGCAKWPPVITTRMDTSMLRGPTRTPYVEVQLVAVSPAEYQSLSTMPVSRYWATDGPSRKDNPNRYVVRLTPNRPTDVIPKDSAIWEKWSDPSRAYLMIFADLADIQDSNPDPRRVVIPLDRAHNKYPPQITITVRRNGIVVEPRPEEKRELFSTSLWPGPDQQDGGAWQGQRAAAVGSAG